MLTTRYLKFIKESNNTKSYYNQSNLIQEICVCMLLINNSFLDKILDLGLKARYSENSHVFLTDLKSLLMAKNRLHIGKFIDGKCIVDDEFSKVNDLFKTIEFDIDKDWNKLINSRIISRNIIDKLIPNEKITEDRISKIFWIGPNKNEDNKEDIVVELTDGKQYSFFLNKNLTSTKTASFNTFADDLIGNEIEKIHSSEYIPKWNKLVQEWVRTIYNNSNKNIQVHIEKFIDENRIDSLDYFTYFQIRHRDPRFKHLGEYIKEFNKNILYLSDLMGEIWKNREICFIDVDTVYNKWMETKVFILNSKILEHLLTESLLKNNMNDIKKLEDGFKSAEGMVKMKLIKTIVEKLGSTEKTIYYLGNNGNIFSQIPSRQFFRENYKDMSIKFDYHVKMVVDDEEEDNNFKIKIELYLKNKNLINLDVVVKFSSHEMSDKLNAKYKFRLADDFNYIVSENEN